jgi:hypothetical protein
MAPKTAHKRGFTPSLDGCLPAASLVLKFGNFRSPSAPKESDDHVERQDS